MIRNKFPNNDEPVRENQPDGLISSHSLSERFNQEEQTSSIRRQVIWRDQSSETNFPHNETACLTKLICFSFLFSLQLPIKEIATKGTKTKTFSDCSADVEIIGAITRTTVFTSKYISQSEASNHYTTTSYLLIRKEVFKSDW